LSRSFGTGNRKTWTYSTWVKRGTLATRQALFGIAGGSDSLTFFMGFDGSDRIEIDGHTLLWKLTTAVYRDPSAWYHIVLAVDTNQGTASNRIKLYVNGVQVTAFSTSNDPSSAADLGVNNNATHYIGQMGSTIYHDGYQSDINFIDGQQLTPSSFGETSATTGVWIPKAYTGTYGTNGFYLDFKDTSSTAALGYDAAGSNDWTVNNVSLTSGATYDSMTDVPTLTSPTAANYCVFSSVASRMNVGSITDGNLAISTYSGNSQKRASFGVTTGKWYWEILVNSSATANMVGVANSSATLSQYLGQNANGWGYYSDGQKYNNGSGSNYGASFTTNDIIGVALDMAAGTLVFYKNNSSQGTAFSGLSGTLFPAVSDASSASSANLICNFGQRPFAYTAPTGFKALCTTNLSTPTIKKPSSYFDTLAYTGTGASNSISSLGFSPDLVWIKNRGGATSHALYDTTRGTGSQLSSNLTDAEVTSSTGLTAFGSNGFTIGTSTLVNTSGTQYVAWGWDEAPIAGFDIVSYQGDGSAGRNISHNLGVAPKFMIVKNRVTAGFDFVVYHASMNATPQNGYMALNETLGYTANSTIWNNTAPTSSVFTVGTNTALNKTGENHIAYLWAEVEGFSKIGSYVGNSSADGVFIWCGFRPRYILFKNPSGGTYWQIYDAARNTYNVVNSDLYAGNASSEQADASLDILSNGFKARSITYINDATINFVAFAEQPFKYARAR
jgi:hypothetical protein